MIIWIASFLAVFAASVFCTCYIQTVRQDNAWLAGFWAALITLTAGAAVISVIGDNSMLLPVMLGSFAGTWVGVKIK
jgi:apolipoprotein N-acyltransferase